MLGELIPLGGGDPIPLLKKKLLVGRRESCDIVLRFSNVSAHHCQLTLVEGYWFVKDMGSRNGIKVNDNRVTEKRLDPGDELAVAKHRYSIQYSPFDLGAVGPPPIEDDAGANLFKKSLLERAGLAGKDVKPIISRSEPQRKRYDVNNDSPGQLRRKDEPV